MLTLATYIGLICDAAGEINFGGDLSNKTLYKKSIEKRKEAEDLTSPPLNSFRVLVAIKEEMTAHTS
jgi:hypothetical protein